MRARWAGDGMPTKLQFYRHIQAICRRCRHIHQSEHVHGVGFDGLSRRGVRAIIAAA